MTIPRPRWEDLDVGRRRPSRRRIRHPRMGRVYPAADRSAANPWRKSNRHAAPVLWASTVGIGRDRAGHASTKGARCQAPILFFCGGIGRADIRREDPGRTACDATEIGRTSDHAEGTTAVGLRVD